MKMPKTQLCKLVINLLDQAIHQQIDTILHKPLLQSLEASWRGIYLLVSKVGCNKRVIVKILQLSWQELLKDTLHNMEFEQSQLFRKICTDELEQAGGYPFGLLLGDYYFNLQHHAPDAIAELQILGKICAASFSCFITSITPENFMIDAFKELHPNNIKLFNTQTNSRWQVLQNNHNSKFIGIVLPKILMRTTYLHHTTAGLNTYMENHEQHADYLWGNPCYAFASVCIQT